MIAGSLARTASLACRGPVPLRGWMAMATAGLPCHSTRLRGPTPNSIRDVRGERPGPCRRPSVQIADLRCGLRRHDDLRSLANRCGVCLLDCPEYVANRRRPRARRPFRIEDQPYAAAGAAPEPDLARIAGRPQQDVVHFSAAAESTPSGFSFGAVMVQIIKGTGDCFFPPRRPGPRTASGSIGKANADAVLHQHPGSLSDRLDLKTIASRYAPSSPAMRPHRDACFHAVDLLLDRGGDGVGHDLGVGPGRPPRP